MSETLVTIIVPIYKVEPFIRRCVESIIGQTHRRIESFLVDDGSPDNCGAICDEYAREDDRITDIHKKNGGVSSARNVALDAATGEYLMFVDGDDWVEYDFCAMALRLAQENEAQLVSFGYNMVYTDIDGKYQNKKLKRIPSYVGFMDASDAVRHLILRDFVMYNYVINKIYRRSMWGDVRFPEGKLWEDQAVTYLMIIRAERVYVSDTVLYSYTKHSDSIMGAMMFSPQTIADRFVIWKDRLPVIRHHCPENEYYQLMEIADVAVSGFIYISPNDKYGWVLNEMRDFLSANRNRLLHVDGSRKTKLKLIMYFYCHPLLILLRKGRNARLLLLPK